MRNDQTLAHQFHGLILGLQLFRLGLGNPCLGLGIQLGRSNLSGTRFLVDALDLSHGPLCCLCACFGQLLRFVFGSQALTFQLRGMLFRLQFFRFDLCGLRFGIGMQLGCSDRFFRQPQRGRRSLAGARLHGNALVFG
ncbi:hypothetical protein RHDC1_01094 [Rhodocyclaceae bacterium]|nr:hypothetical protein RHDC1_01094 [Rhodocyclaceae bacterium]